MPVFHGGRSPRRLRARRSGRGFISDSSRKKDSPRKDRMAPRKALETLTQARWLHKPAGAGRMVLGLQTCRPMTDVRSRGSRLRAPQ